MLTPVRRRLATLALALVLPAALAGCRYQTDEIYQPGVGVNNRKGDVDILGAVVVSGTAGSGTFVASLANKDAGKPATLTTVTGPKGYTITVVKQVTVNPEGLVNLANLGAVQVNGPDVAAGNFVRLTLNFDTGQSTQLNVPIVDKDGEFSGVSPVVPSASATP